MSTHRIVIEMEGPDPNGKHLDLQIFLEKVGQLKAFLNSIVKDEDRKQVGLTLVGLSHSSPAVLECQPYRKNEPDASLVMACDHYLGLVNTGKTANIPHPILSAMENLAELKPNKIARVELRITGSTLDNVHIWKLDDAFRSKLAQARSADDIQINTIDGKLEAIDIHGKRTFKIFTWAPSIASVKCAFPKEMLEQVTGALGKWVSVSGECHNRPDAIMPHEIHVHKIEVLPPSKDLPTLSDLRGIAPGATGGKSSEQFVRELRDKWN